MSVALALASLICAITGVVIVGDPDSTTLVVPVDVVTPVPPLATGKVPMTPVVSGSPVAFVRIAVTVPLIVVVLVPAVLPMDIVVVLPANPPVPTLSVFVFPLAVAPASILIVLLAVD